MSGAAGLLEDSELEAALFGSQDGGPKGTTPKEETKAANLFEEADQDVDIEAALFGKSLSHVDREGVGGPSNSNKGGDGVAAIEEEEDDLYGTLYGDMGLQASEGETEEQKTSTLPALETLLGVSDQTMVHRIDGSLEVEEALAAEEDTAKLAAVVGLATPGLDATPEEDEESDSDSDSEDEFEILVNDDHFRPPVGHSDMPPISRVPAKAPAEEDDSDSESDSFDIILDDDGAPDRKRPYEEDQGLQREYSLKLPSLPGFDGSAPESQDPARTHSNQEAPRVQGGMMPYGGRGGRRGWQQQRAPVNEIYLPNASLVFELNLEELENKPWRFQGADLSDYFNFDLNEQTWKEYCQQLAQARLEQTMQGKIRVYESRAANGLEADPDLPPELADALKKDNGAPSPQLIRSGGFQANRGGPSNEIRRFRPRDFDAVIEIQVQNDAPIQSPPVPVPPLVKANDEAPVEEAPLAVKAEEEAPVREVKAGGSLEKEAPEVTADNDAETSRTAGQEKAEDAVAGAGRESAAGAQDEITEDEENKTNEQLAEGVVAKGAEGSEPKEAPSQVDAPEETTEADIKRNTDALSSQNKEADKTNARNGPSSPSRSQAAAPPERKRDAEKTRNAHRGVREASRDRPLSRGNGRPNLPPGGLVRPPFFPGGPQGLAERGPFWGEPGFRPPLTPYGPESYHWGVNGPAFPGDPAFFGPRFFPPGPFEPGMGPPMRPVDGPWGPPYPGMRPGPVPRALQRPKPRRESSSSEESSSHQSSSGSGSDAGSESESSSGSETSKRRNRRSESRRYAEGAAHFNEFARGPGFRIVYDDLGRPVELDPYGRPLDPRRAAEYDDFMRRQFPQEGRAFGGRGWDDRGPARGRGRGRDGRLPEEVYAARRRERDERIERERQERERRSRTQREPSRSYDDRSRGLSRGVDERRPYREERGRFGDSSRDLEEDVSRYRDRSPRHRESRARYQDEGDEERAYRWKEDCDPHERKERRRKGEDASTEDAKGESRRERRARQETRSPRWDMPDDDRASGRDRERERSPSVESRDRIASQRVWKQTTSEPSFHEQGLGETKAEGLRSKDNDVRGMEADGEGLADVIGRQQDDAREAGLEPQKENGLEIHKIAVDDSRLAEEVQLSEADLAEADQRFRAGELGQGTEMDGTQLESDDKAANREGGEAQMEGSKEEHRRTRRERRRERRGKNETEEEKEARRRHRKERKERERAGGQLEEDHAEIGKAEAVVQGREYKDQEPERRGQKGAGSKSATEQLSEEGTGHRSKEGEAGRDELITVESAMALESVELQRERHQEDEKEKGLSYQEDRPKDETRQEREQERRHRHRERKERRSMQERGVAESQEGKGGNELHRDKKRRRHRENEDAGRREEEELPVQETELPRDVETDPQEIVIEKQKTSRREDEQLEGIAVNKHNEREGVGGVKDDGVDRNRRERAEHGNEDVNEKAERKRHRKHRHREGDDDREARRERRKERRERKGTETEEGAQLGGDRQDQQRSEGRERAVDESGKDSGQGRIRTRGESEETRLESKRSDLHGHGRSTDRQRDRGERKDEHSSSDFEAKLRRRAERFGTSEAGSARDAEELPRGSFKDGEQRAVAGAADPLSGFRDLDRPEEEPQALSAKGDGSGGKRKRENGAAEGGTRNWNEVKFKIPGVGGGGEAVSAAKRRVLNPPSEGAEVDPRPSRVVIPDLGAKKDAENARKRMFQQALLGVGAPGRSSSSKSLGRREG